MIGNFRLPVSQGSNIITDYDWTITRWQEAYNRYVRPVDWLDITTSYPLVNGNQKIVALHAIFENSENFCAFLATTSTGQYSVDWGDGTTTLHNSNTTAYKTYDYATISSGTISSRGYKQVVVVITPVSGNFVTVNFTQKHNLTGLNTYSSNWLDIRIAGNAITLLTLNSGVVNHYLLELFEFIGTNAITNGSNAFSGLRSLQRIVSFYTGLITNSTSMFANLSSILSYPLLDFSSLTTGDGMFLGNKSVEYHAYYNFSTLITVSSIFDGNFKTKGYPLYNFSNVTTAQYAFRDNRCVKTYPLFDFSKLTSGPYLFTNNSSVVQYPAFNFTLLTNANYMFMGNTSIAEYPLFTFNSLTLGYGMFQDNYAVVEHKLYNFSAMIDISYIFSNNLSVLEHPLYNFQNVVTADFAFSGNNAVLEYPLFNFIKVTSANGLFNGNTVLQKIPLFNFSVVLNAANMFSGCVSIPLYPAINFPVGTDLRNTFSSNSSLQSIPAINLNTFSSGNLANAFASCSSVEKVDLINIKQTISFASMRLSKTAIHNIFNNLLTVSGLTITISGNYGADTAISKTSCGTTAGSAVVTQSNTASLAVGMLVLGTGISTAQAVSFQDTGDTVTLNAHGLVDGNIVSFPTIVTTTGIVINKPYFVVNATTNTFQVSLTVGGSAIVLTTDGTGTVAYGSYIQSIITNTSFTLDKPASATGTVTLTSRILDTSIATLKGWTVTG